MYSEREIAEIIELVGVDRILEDNYMTLPFAIGILEELGYLNLDMYTTEQQ